MSARRATNAPLPHRLDRAAAAYDQRRVAIVYGRALLFIGLSEAVGYLAGKPFVKEGLTALAEALVGVVLLAFLTRSGPRRLRWGAAPALVLAGALSIVLGCTLLGHHATLDSPLHFKAPEEHAIALAQSAYEEPPWRVARAIAAVPMLLLGVEMLVSAFLLVRLPDEDLALLVEPRVSVWATAGQWFFGLGPDMRFMKKDWRARPLAIAGAIAFTVAAINVATSPDILRNQAIGELLDCTPPGRPDVVACVGQVENGAPFGMALGTLAWLFVLPALGSWSTRGAEWFSARSAARRMPDSMGVSVLYLRDFNGDATPLRAPRATPMRWALSSGRRKQVLDVVILREFMRLGPPRALGDPRDAGIPFGAVRAYVLEPNDEAWRAEVKRWAPVAKAIVMVFGEAIEPGHGVAWELEQLRTRPELRAKTLFLAPTSLQIRRGESVRDHRARCRRAWIATGVLAGFTPPDTEEPLVGLRVDAEGNVTRCTTAMRATATTMQLALRAAFGELA